MKQPFIQRSREPGPQRGVTMVLVAISMVAIIAMAAISIDVITLYLAKEEAQRAADTAALAAARVISLSGVTGDPLNAPSWQAVCDGDTSPASQTATAVALQNVVGGAAANSVTVTYGGPSNKVCSSLISGSPNAFSVNPTVTVLVQRTNLPNFFSRVWSRSGTNLSASATAEVFNSSYSASVGGSDVIPVQPACVKPWFVPNHDPMNPGQDGNGVWCDNNDPRNPNNSCKPLVSLADGSITNPGISLNGTNANGLIGETFGLAANCTHTGSGCSFRTNPIRANLIGNGYVNNGNGQNLLYYPGQAPTTTPVAVPSCSSGGNVYEKAIAGCDQSTAYKCGVALSNTLDLSENPSILGGDTSTGVQCLTHQGSAFGGPTDGQDTLNDSAFPFQVLAGDLNPMVLNAGLTSGTPISTSNSIVSLPIFDDSAVTVGGPGTTTQVTIVGFMQVFINQIDQNASMTVTVLNVTGCGNGSTTTVGSNPVGGTSPVPIRLITPQ